MKEINGEIPSKVHADPPELSVPYGPFKDLPPPREAREENGLELHLKSSEIKVIQGHFFRITGTIFNKSKKTIYYNYSTIDRIYGKVSSYDASGKLETYPSIEDNMENRPIPMDIDGFEMRYLDGRWKTELGSPYNPARTLKPGETNDYGYKVRIMEPGIYRYVMRVSSGSAADHRGNLWFGELESNEIYIDVVPNLLLPSLGKRLVLTIEPEKKNCPFGTKMRIKGTLKNGGADKVSIDKNQLALVVSGYEYNGQEELFRVRFNDHILEEKVVELKPEDSVTVELMELVPSSYAGSTIKVKATARVQIFCEGLPYEIEIESSNAAEISIGMPQL